MELEIITLVYLYTYFKAVSDSLIVQLYFQLFLPGCAAKTPGANMSAPRSTAAPQLLSTITSFSYRGKLSLENDDVTSKISVNNGCVVME